jgi:hypothetical protein
MGSGAARPGVPRDQPPANDEPGAAAQGRLGGHVVDAEGRPVAGALVLIASGPVHADIALETGPDGRFDYGELDAGRYLLTTRAQGFLPRNEDVRVLAGLRAETRIVLQPERRPSRPSLPRGPQQRAPEPPRRPQPDRRPPPGDGGGGRWFAPEAPPDRDDEGWEME